MRVLALDIASQTGVAFGHVGGVPISFTVDLGKGSDCERFSKAYRMADHLIRKFQPDVIAIEQEVGGLKRSGFLTGYIACVKAAAGTHGVRVQEHNIGAVRSHFVGKNITSAATQFKHLTPRQRKTAARGVAKALTIAKCKMLGWNPKNDDEGDAMSIFDFQCSQMSRAHQVATVGGLFRV